MATYYWTGYTIDKKWSNPGNWSLTLNGPSTEKTMPGPNDDVIYGTGGGGSSIVDMNFTIRSIDMTNFGGTFVMNAPYTVTLTGPFPSSSMTIFTGNNSYSTAGTPVFNVNYAGGSGTGVSIISGRSLASQNISWNFTSGSYTITITDGSYWKNLNFTGWSGSFTGGMNTLFILGNLTLSATATGYLTTTGTWIFYSVAATAATPSIITTNGVVINTNVRFGDDGQGVGGSYRLADNFTMNSARTLTHNNGTIDLNGKVLTVGRSYTTGPTSGTGNKNITFNGGTLVCPGTDFIAFNNAKPTGFTTTAGTGTGKISMTGGWANSVIRTFVGGGSTYNCTLSNDNSTSLSFLTITGSNTFTAIATTGRANIVIASGTTQTFTNWNISGTAGNLITITSDTYSSPAILSKSSGTVSSDYISLTDITATGGATWYAGANSNSVRSTGWSLSTTPNRYWVGGAGTWDTSTTTNWSLYSGGPGGASVPTSATNVIFDQAGTYQVSLYGALTCLDLTVSAGTITFAGDIGPPDLAISGNMILIAGTVWQSQCRITFNSTATGKTITTNGVSITGLITFDGTGGGWTLGSALTSANIITLTAGSVDTGNYNVIATSLASSGTGTRSLNLGSSTVTLSDRAPINITGTTNFTFNCGTSTISSTYSTVGFGVDLYFGNLTYYNLTFVGGNDFSFNSGMTCNNLTFLPMTNLMTGRIQLFGNITCTGTLTASGFQGGGRIIFVTERSGAFTTFVDYPGVTRTITAAAVSLSDIDFMDITAAGAAIPFSGTRLGDAGGNTNISFTATKTVYLVGKVGSTAAWQSSNWSNTSGGLSSINNYPLLQDTAVIDNNSLASGGTLYFYVASSTRLPWFGNMTFANRNIPMTITNLYMTAVGPRLTGNVTLSPSVTFNLFATVFSGSGTITRTFNNNGATWSAGDTYTNYISTGGIWKLGADMNTNGRTLGLVSGTFDLNDKNLTVNRISINGGTATTDAVTPRTLIMGNGTITIEGNNSSVSVPVFEGNTASTTTTFNTNAKFIFTSASPKTFNGPRSDLGVVNNWPTVVQAGAGVLVFKGLNNVYNIANTVTPALVSFMPGSGNATTFSNGFSLRGTAGNPVTITPNVAATSYTLNFSNTTVGTDYLSISYCTAINGNVYVGANSTDGGNNTGLTFAAAPAVNSNVNISMSGGTVIRGGARFT